MQPVRPMHPKLDPLCLHAEPAPVRRPRHFSRMLLGKSLEACFQFLTACERPALLRDGGADLTVARPAVEVCVHIGRFHLRYPPLHSYLPAKGFPVEAKGCPGI